MALEVKAGTRLRSAVCDTEVIVVRAPASDLDLRCGGQPMIPHGSEPPVDAGLDPAHGEGTLLGKRYADEELGLELLCTKAGKGSLSVGEVPLGLKEAKPLPSSD
ncbi:MAG: hypothetical protein M5U14_17070 [Acidimicrobiia bacterium]|nr:hypothetical protein [Acidimicrobiia bacterium]